jgi:putative transposase
MRKPRGPRPALIELTDRQRALLEEIAAGRRRPHDEVQRAAMILQSADGARTRHLAEVFGVSDPTIRLWRARWVQATPQLVAAEAEADEETLGILLQQVLRDTPRRGRPATFTPEQLCHIVAVACEAPADCGRPVTHWTPRELAEEVISRGIVPRISPRSVGRFLKRSGLETTAVTLLAQSQTRRRPRAI